VEEKKTTVIPLVTASEQGKAQTENLVQLTLNPNCSLSSSILCVVDFLKNDWVVLFFFHVFFSQGKNAWEKKKHL